MPTRDLAHDLARHAAETPASAVLSDAVVAHLAHDLADTLGVMLGGLTAPGVAATRAVIGDDLRAGAARVFGTGERWPATYAALANAPAGHALDYDDTLDEGGSMHAGNPVHAAALAVADELGNVTGEQYLTAVALGLDVAVRLALTPSDDYGWHRTSAFGVFGVAAAVGRLLGLDAERMRDALGIAYSQASGNRQCIADGALSKRVQAGFAARDGITAVRLAARGVTGAVNIFEGVNGFFPLYQRGGYDRDVVLAGLGEDILSRRIALKPYPCGRPLHALTDAALELHQRVQGRVVEAVEVGMGPRFASVERAFPAHVVEAQFSPEFAAALALLEGRLTITAFAEPASVSDAVKALMGRTRVVEWLGAGAAGAYVEARLAEGTVERAEALVARGHPSKPLSEAEVRAKFHDCHESAGAPIGDRAAAALDAALNVQSLSNTRLLTDLLALPASAR